MTVLPAARSAAAHRGRPRGKPATPLIIFASAGVPPHPLTVNVTPRPALLRSDDPVAPARPPAPSARRTAAPAIQATGRGGRGAVSQLPRPPVTPPKASGTASASIVGGSDG